MNTKAATTKAAVEYARQLRRRAEQITNPGSVAYDPYAKPYAPSDDAAYKLCQRCRKQAIAAATDKARAEGREPTAAELEAADATGPQLAIAEMAFKSSSRQREARREQEEADQRRQRHANRQRRAAAELERERAGLTVGQRIDQALAALSTIPAAAAAASFDAPHVSGGGGDGGMPLHPGDPAAKAQAIARNACNQIEDELDTARRRRVEREAA